MNPILRRYATLAVPRYTSYPTAPHFSDAVGAEQYADWLRGLDARDQAISLYVHIPFCDKLCWYCGCNMKLAARYAPVAAYAKSLRREIDLIADLLPRRARVGHIHFGGGTPTSLRPDDLAGVLGVLRARFDVAADAELAIEADPRTLSDEMIARIGALGFTRASFGVQEFDADVQRAINRIQPPEMVARSVRSLRAVGVSRINFDLIYGLPLQSEAKIIDTIDLCAAMKPDRLALFGYAHVPWMAKKQRLIAPETLPGAAERSAQAEAAAAALLGHGFQAVGLDHFAAPDDPLAQAARAGTLRRNFQGYTTDTAETMIGFGASSIGRTPNGYVQNLTETGAWARQIAEGRPPIARGVAFAGEDLLRAYVIERLMCDGAVDVSAAGRRFGAPGDWADQAMAHLALLAIDGIVEVGAGRVALTERGKPLARVAAAAFDAYRDASAARHSAAV